MTPPRILVIDDEAGIREVCRLNLELGGCTVVEAVDGKEGLAAIRAERPDLVFLDARMPNLDGWGVVDALRGTADSPPVVLLTASSGHGERERAAEAGLRFLAKPFHPRQLIEIVDEVLGPAARQP